MKWDVHSYLPLFFPSAGTGVCWGGGGGGGAIHCRVQAKVMCVLVAWVSAWGVLYIATFKLK